MERTTYHDLLAWKTKKNRKPLLISGVRQCGKTYLIQQFGEKEFEDCAYFNFDGNEGLASVFAYDLDPERIIQELGSVIREKEIVPGETLVVFDEVQACPRALMSLKYFCENMPQLHVIAAGSLLGVALRQGGISFPVGKVDRLEMFPLSFEEFVTADGGEKYISGVKGFSLDRELGALYSVPLEKYLKNYYVVGGMPEAVQVWVDTHNYKMTEAVQERILRDYADDFGKYATPETMSKIRLIWDSIPVQIAKENNKFMFSHVKAGARAKDLEDALEWLVGAGVVYKVSKVSKPELPLSAMADYSYFKVYMADVGLLRKKANVHYKTILDGDSAYVHFKGALAENYVLTQLKCLHIESYFWRSDANAEVDFIVDYEGVITPIEVKSADNTKSKSLHLFCSRYKPRIAVKTSLKNIGDNTDGNTRVWSIPLYVLFRLREYLLS